ncbi:3-carboxy-cis,cis-muconate cycloisomerase [Gammaproteobacteria bacterium]|nr:3-carboxy-cis,cis-muconate cycloisomerase [Gammaproteobacteria bacterium]
MSVSLYDSAVYGPLFSDRRIVELFSDQRRIETMLAVEVDLAQVQADLGIIPGHAAAAIAQGASDLRPDMESLGAGTRRAGVPVVELVSQLRHAAGPDNSGYVHYGATSQDIIDTAHVIQIREALDYQEDQLNALIRELAAVTHKYRHTLMVARTRSQQALPTTFGFKVAGWLLPLIRHRERLTELKPRLLVLQFGGAVGTLAALHDRGIKTMEALAVRLNLYAPVMPWHSQRDGFAEFANWLALLTGSLGKIGQDIILLAQSEVAEVAERADQNAGASSTMPNKSNPITCEMLVAAARMNATLLANMHHALIAEHERATHGWQLEWITLPQMMCNTSAALGHTRTVVNNMIVDENRMHINLDTSNGLVLAEMAAFRLSAEAGWGRARQLVATACAESRRSGRHLMEVLDDVDDSGIEWSDCKDPARYLGHADEFIDRVLSEVGVLR